MLDLLVDDGALCLIDFTQRRPLPTGWSASTRRGSASTASTSTATRSVTTRARTAPAYYAEERSRVPYAGTHAPPVRRPQGGPMRWVLVRRTSVFAHPSVFVLRLIARGNLTRTTRHVRTPPQPLAIRSAYSKSPRASG